MLKNIIFDVAKVLLTFDRDDILSHFDLKDDYDFFKERLFHDWEKLDEDLLTLSEYENNVMKSLPNKFHKIAKEILDTWENYMDFTPHIIDYVKELKKKGYKLYILSNMTRHFIERDYMFNDLFKYFDGIVYSAPIKLVKPDPKIFEYILNEYSLNPKECLFIDDNKTNLVSATRFGMKTFLFNNNLDDLKEYVLTL